MCTGGLCRLVATVEICLNLAVGDDEVASRWVTEAGLGGWGFPTVGGRSDRRAENHCLRTSLLFHLPLNILYLNNLPATAFLSEEIAAQLPLSCKVPLIPSGTNSGRQHFCQESKKDR